MGRGARHSQQAAELRDVTHVESFASRRPHRLTAGVVDEAAVTVFTRGQCHALALELHDATGWPLVQIGNASHFMCRSPDGRLVDITGAHAQDLVMAGWPGRCFDLTRDELVQTVAQGRYLRPDLAAARLFVDAVRGYVEQNAAPAAPPPRMNV